MKFREENGKVFITSNRRTNGDYLTSCERVTCAPQKMTPIDSCLNYIRVSRGIMDKLQSKYCSLVNLKDGTFIDAAVDGTPLESEGNVISITGYAQKIIKETEGTELILCKQKYSVFSSVKSQKLENVKSDALVIPAGSEIEPFLKDFRLFEIINPLTNDSIFVRSKHIIIDSTLESDEIRINKKQREMLSDNIPVRLSEAEWNDLIADNSAEGLLEGLYSPDGSSYIINSSLDAIPYGVKTSLRAMVKKKFGEKLIVRPVIESFAYEKKRSITKRLCDFFVGKSTLSLNCRRPHECDENTNIVRMTEDNMLLLGIEAMDKVILQYKEKTFSCHVLPFDSEKYGCTNVPGIMEFSVGIPAYVRNKLGIVDIQSSVKVDRDTTFIFKKSFNEQLVPIILTILSLNFFENIRWYTALLLIAAILPVITYITLSSKRNIRGK